MGRFYGHVGNGLYMTTWALTNSLAATERCYRAQYDASDGTKQRRHRYRNRVEFVLMRFNRRVPLDSLCKLWWSLMGIAHSTWDTYASWDVAQAGDEMARHDRYLGLQHSTLYAMWGLYAAVEAMTFLRVRFLPPDSAYGFFVLASLGEAFLHVNHFHSSNPLDEKVHHFILLCSFGKALACVGEMLARRSLLAAQTRYFFMLL